MRLTFQFRLIAYPGVVDEGGIFQTLPDHATHFFRWHGSHNVLHQNTFQQWQRTLQGTLWTAVWKTVAENMIIIILIIAIIIIVIIIIVWT